MARPEDVSADLAAMHSALLSAAPLFREGYGVDFAVRAKSHGDFQSDLDVALDRAIRDALARSMPGTAVLSEELGGPSIETVEDVIVVDPLDGTSAFLHRTNPAHPSMMIARVRHGEPVAACVHFPLTDECFYAAKGRGAYMNGELLRTSLTARPLRDSRVILNQYADAQFESTVFRHLALALRRPGEIAPGLVTVEAPHSGAACRAIEPHSTVAAVLHDNSPRRPKQCVWDLAAPKLIVEEAGGVFWNLAGQPYSLTEVGPIVIARSHEIGSRLVREAHQDPVLAAAALPTPPST